MKETLLTQKPPAKSNRQWERLQAVRRRLLSDPGALDSDAQFKLELLSLLARPETTEATRLLLQHMVPSRAVTFLHAADVVLGKGVVDGGE